MVPLLFPLPSQIVPSISCLVDLELIVIELLCLILQSTKLKVTTREMALLLLHCRLLFRRTTFLLLSVALNGLILWLFLFFQLMIVCHFYCVFPKWTFFRFFTRHIIL